MTQPIFWIYAVGIAVIGLAAGLLLAAFIRRRFGPKKAPAMTSDQAQEHWRRQLLIGDAKVSIVLAIQRHTSDAVYRENLQREPSFIELRPYLSSEFMAMMMSDPVSSAVGSQGPLAPSLAVAYRMEIERLELDWGGRV